MSAPEAKGSHSGPKKGVVLEPEQVNSTPKCRAVNHSGRSR